MTQDTNLTEIIGQAITGKTVTTGVKDAARAVHEAGYRRPRVITTAEELEVLPARAIIKSTEGTVYHCVGEGGSSRHGWIWSDEEEQALWSSEIDLPAIVLWEPHP